MNVCTSKLTCFNPLIFVKVVYLDKIIIKQGCCIPLSRELSCVSPNYVQNMIKSCDKIDILLFSAIAEELSMQNGVFIAFSKKLKLIFCLT